MKRTHTKPDKCKVKGKGHTEAFAGLKSHCVVITNNEQSRKTYTRGDRVRVQLKCETDNEDCVVNAEIEDNKDGTYKASFLVKEPGKYDMSVMVNEEPVQGLDPFTTVQVNPREFKAVLSIGREGTYYSGRFKNPWGVSVNERDEIVVADCNNARVQVFKSDGKTMSCFGKRGEKNGEFVEPTGVACDGQGYILVSDKVNSTVQLFNGTGKFEFVGLFREKGDVILVINESRCFQPKESFCLNLAPEQKSLPSLSIASFMVNISSCRMLVSIVLSSLTQRVVFSFISARKAMETESSTCLLV